MSLADNALTPDLASLIADAGISQQDFASVLSTRDPARPKILVRLRGADRATTQREAAAVLLAVSRAAGGRAEWPVFDLRDALKESNIDANALSKGLVEGDGGRYFKKSGVKTGTKYTLEVPGRDFALGILPRLVQLSKRPPAPPVSDLGSSEPEESDGGPPPTTPNE